MSDVLASRRAVLRAAAGAAAVAAFSARDLAAGARDAFATVPAEALDVSAEPVVHLLRRLTYGPTPALVDRLRRAYAERGEAALDAWVDEQLSYDGTTPQPRISTMLAKFETLAYTDREGYTKSQQLGDADTKTWPRLEVQTATLIRQVHSEHQVFETVVELWRDHFSIWSYGVDPAITWIDANAYAPAYDRAIRAHATGTFRDLLRAVAKNHAMLAYLDQKKATAYTSLGASLSPSVEDNRIVENYARELLELHTVGARDGGYTHADIVNAARTLTGWTAYHVTDAAHHGEFWFNPNAHYVGEVRVLGWSHPNAAPADGLAAGESLLDYLARHPATAYRLGEKLVRRYVADVTEANRAELDPLIRRLAQVYLDHDTAIRPVLRALFTSPELRSAAYAGRKYRRSMEWFTSLVRALQVRDAATNPPPANLGAAEPPHAEHPGYANDYAYVVVNGLGSMGHLPGAWPDPDGYPDVAAPWLSVSGLHKRFKLVDDWVNDPADGSKRYVTVGKLGRPSVTGADGVLATAVPPIPEPATMAAGELVDTLARRLLFQDPHPSLRQLLVTYLCHATGSAYDPAKQITLKESTDALGLSTQDTPAVRACLQLVLTSPYFFAR